MTERFKWGLIWTFAISTVACGGDGLGPIPNKTPTSTTWEPRVFTVVELSPAVDTVFEGYARQLGTTLRSQYGDRMFDKPTAVSYTSSDPGVAVVSTTGVVTAVAPGTATISASVTIGTSTKSGMMTTSVLPPDAAPSEVLLTSASHGWEPAEAHLRAGGTAHWVAGAVSWSGVPNKTLWLMNADFADLDNVDLSGGSVTRKFDKPGVIRYCSGGCWDLGDYGVIYIH